MDKKAENVKRQLKWRKKHPEKFRENENRRMKAKTILRSRHLKEYKQILKDLKNGNQ